MDNPFAKQFKTQVSDNPFTQQFGVTPSDVNNANITASKPDVSKYNGYCQQFVDDVIGTPPQNRAPSASAAWNNYSQTGQGIQGTKGMQPGDIIYFNDPNDPNGHVGIFSGGDKFISATQENPNKPVQNHTIKGWTDLTGDSILGYVKNPSNLPAIGGSYGRE